VSADLPIGVVDSGAGIGQSGRMVVPSVDGDELYVRASWSARMLGSPAWLAPVAPVVGLLVLFAATSMPWPVRVGAAAASIGLGCFVGVRSWGHLGLRLTPTSVRFERVFSSAEVAWADVLAVRLPWTAGRSGSGYAAFIVPTADHPASVGYVPPLDGVGCVLMRQYIGARVPGVRVDPTEPWQDRFGQWHGPMLEFDPEESIRTVRRAAVGSLVIRIEVSADGFRVVTSDPAGRSVRESSSIADLPTATSTAIEHIRLARSSA
jgi:hypothetical protein